MSFWWMTYQSPNNYNCARNNWILMLRASLSTLNEIVHLPLLWLRDSELHMSIWLTMYPIDESILKLDFSIQSITLVLIKWEQSSFIAQVSKPIINSSLIPSLKLYSRHLRQRIDDHDDDGCLIQRIKMTISYLNNTNTTNQLPKGMNLWNNVPWYMIFVLEGCVIGGSNLITAMSVVRYEALRSAKQYIIMMGLAFADFLNMMIFLSAGKAVIMMMMMVTLLLCVSLQAPIASFSYIWMTTTNQWLLGGAQPTFWVFSCPLPHTSVVSCLLLWA